MGRPCRNRPRLLPDKLLVIREYLDVSRAEMASMLYTQILSHSRNEYQFKGGRIAAWESGKREPDMLVHLAYSRLAHVSLDLMIDDACSVEAFRKLLRKELKSKKKVAEKKKSKS